MVNVVQILFPHNVVFNPGSCCSLFVEIAVLDPQGALILLHFGESHCQLVHLAGATPLALVKISINSMQVC